MDNRLATALCIAALWALPQTVQAGTQQFCAQWAYTFDDQGLGEDFLLHNAGQGALGVVLAPGAESVISRDGARIWEGRLDADGCTGIVDAPSGSYTFWVTAASIERGDVRFRIFPDDSETPQWFSTTWDSLTEQPLQRKDTVTLGYGYPTASVAALATLAMQRNDVGLPAGNYEIFAQQNCPGQAAFSGCFTGASIFLGQDLLGNFESFNKSVVAHELGHFAQNSLFGNLANPYGYDGGSMFPLCSCDHVTSSNKAHCLQSIEHHSAAQVEGYAHFFAANLLNDGAQPDAAFAYYKEVNAFNQTNPPPWVVAPLSAFLWRQTHCPLSGENGDTLGTELDWMAFYYALHNTGGPNAFSFADLRATYTNACQGQLCAGQDVTYVQLSGHVVSLFSQDKARYWQDLGVSRGVSP